MNLYMTYSLQGCRSMLSDFTFNAISIKNRAKNNAGRNSAKTAALYKYTPGFGHLTISPTNAMTENKIKMIGIISAGY